MAAHNLNTLEDIKVAVRFIDDELAKIRNNNWDLHMRRLVNASASVDPEDYVIQKELTDKAAELQSEIDAINLKVNATEAKVDLPEEWIAPCTGNTNAPNGSFLAVTGCSVNLNRTGLYLLTAVAQVQVDVAATGINVYLNEGGVQRVQRISVGIFTGVGTDTHLGNHSQFWFVQVFDIPITCFLECDKGGAGGTAVVIMAHTQLHARFIGAKVSLGV